jgi:anti-sigma regulatory factor (Ser/Thr protein kinase)
MDSDRTGAARDDASRGETERLHGTVRRQAAAIATLSKAVSNIRRGVEALRLENAELRAESDDLRDRLLMLSRADDELVETVIAAGPRAPAIARRVLTEALADRVAEPVLADAQLLMSELVTNSVRHSGVPAGDELIVRLRVWERYCRLEVEDTGHDGAIAPRTPDPLEGGGMGLNLVESLSERWGLVRAADGPTRVWAQLEMEWYAA